jgi:hypothetical protein
MRPSPFQFGINTCEQQCERNFLRSKELRRSARCAPAAKIREGGAHRRARNAREFSVWSDSGANKAVRWDKVACRMVGLRKPFQPRPGALAQRVVHQPLFCAGY